MALTVINTSYAGEVVDTILTLTITGNEVAEKGLVHIVPGIRDTLSIPRLRQGSVLQSRVAMPSEANVKGGQKWSERKLEPKDVMVYDRFNPRDCEHIWRKWQPEGPLVFSQLPSEIQSKMMELLLAQVQGEVGDQLINGKRGATSGSNLFDGFVTRMESDTDKKIVTSTGTTVLDHLKSLREAIPATLRGNKALKILMSVADFDLYDEELTARPSKGVDYTDITVSRFKSIPIEPLVRWPEGLFVATPCSVDTNSNLWSAVNFANDENNILIDKVANDGELYFVKLLMKIDTQIAQGEELVWLDKRV